MIEKFKQFDYIVKKEKKNKIQKTFEKLSK